MPWKPFTSFFNSVDKIYCSNGSNRRLLSGTNLFVVLVFCFSSCSYDDIFREPICDGSLIVTLLSKTNLTTCAANDGSITVEVLGGTAPYQFSLNGGTAQALPTFPGLSAGDYQITVLDANNCEAQIANIEITVPGSDLNLVASTVADTDCLTSNGSISLLASGGSGGYTFRLNSPSFETSSSFFGIAPGEYDATVKDSQGCQFTISVTLSQGSTGIKWSTQVKDILANRCVTCHPGSGGTSDDWANYTSVFNKRNIIRTRVSGGTMPPSGQTQLTPTEKALIVCWIDDGAPNN